MVEFCFNLGFTPQREDQRATTPKADPKAFIEDLESSGFCENMGLVDGLGGVLSLAGSKNLTSRPLM